MDRIGPRIIAGVHASNFTATWFHFRSFSPLRRNGLYGGGDSIPASGGGAIFGLAILATASRRRR